MTSKLTTSGFDPSTGFGVSGLTTSSSFRNPLGLEFSLESVAQEVYAFMHERPLYPYRITIGTDSERLSSGMADFVTAVVVHRVGNGGRYFWTRTKGGPYHTLRDRIIKEVFLSLEIGKNLFTACSEHLSLPGERDGLSPSWSFEVHADIGENGPTKDMIQEVLGMIRAYNFEPRMKPASYAASSVADRHV